jgi:acyl-CoA synthetase (AMP-forming)/AMP-acid ligase II
MADIGKMIGPGGEFEMVQMTRSDHPEWGDLLCFKRGPKTLGDYYEQTMTKFSDKTFMVFEDERLTFGETRQRMFALGAALVDDFGVKPGDRVAVSMRNYPEWAISFMAVTTIGAICVPLNSLWKEKEFLYGLEDSGTKVFIADEERFSLASMALKKLDIPAIVTRAKKPVEAADFDSVLKSGMGKMGIGPQPHTDDAALIMYTSGTTGNPKGVVLTHRGVCNQMIMSMLGDAIGSANNKDTEQPCAIVPVPLFHVTGSHHIFLASLISGRKLVFM